MSKLAALLRRLGRSLAAPASSMSDPDHLSLRDWSDLPAYHPRCDTPR